LGKGGGAPLPVATGDDVIRGGSTGGVDGLESGRGTLSARSKRTEARMGGREVLTWAGISWTGGGAAVGEGVTAAGEGATVAGEGGMMVGEGRTMVEEEGFVEFSTLARGRGEVIAGFRFLFGNGGGTTAIAGSMGGGNLLCS